MLAQTDIRRPEYGQRFRVFQAIRDAVTIHVVAYSHAIDLRSFRQSHKAGVSDPDLVIRGGWRNKNVLLISITDRIYTHNAPIIHIRDKYPLTIKRDIQSPGYCRHRQIGRIIHHDTSLMTPIHQTPQPDRHLPSGAYIHASNSSACVLQIVIQYILKVRHHRTNRSHTYKSRIIIINVSPQGIRIDRRASTCQRILITPILHTGNISPINTDRGQAQRKYPRLPNRHLIKFDSRGNRNSVSNFGHLVFPGQP